VSAAAPAPAERLEVVSWNDAPEPARKAARETLESGRVAFLPDLAFALRPGEKRLVFGRFSDGRAKNVSWDGARRELTGARGSRDDVAGLEALLDRFRAEAGRLVPTLVPEYGPFLETARTSLRLAEVWNRPQSRTANDRLLHMDAFPARPTGGRRILRVFSNVGETPRVWRIGEPFAAAAGRLWPRLRPLWPAEAPALRALGITRGLRTPYDHAMLRLHDALKAEDRAGRATPPATFAFPPGSTWIAFTDQVLHAAVAGRGLLEQTFHIPVQAMAEPASSPLRVLESLAGRALAP